MRFRFFFQPRSMLIMYSLMKKLWRAGDRFFVDICALLHERVSSIMQCVSAPSEYAGDSCLEYRRISIKEKNYEENVTKMNWQQVKMTSSCSNLYYTIINTTLLNEIRINVFCWVYSITTYNKQLW